MESGAAPLGCHSALRVWCSSYIYRIRGKRLKWETAGARCLRRRILRWKIVRKYCDVNTCQSANFL